MQRIYKEPRFWGFFTSEVTNGSDYWGQGYATESVRGLLNYAKSNTPCEKFKANVFKENVASAKVLEKNGFKRVGDEEVFSISRQENVLSVNYEFC